MLYSCAGAFDATTERTEGGLTKLTPSLPLFTPGVINEIPKRIALDTARISPAGASRAEGGRA